MSVPPVSRQPSCRYCEHEEHVFTRCHALLGDSGVVLCPCPPHRPVGIYLDTTTATTTEGNTP